MLVDGRFEVFEDLFFLSLTSYDRLQGVSNRCAAAPFVDLDIFVIIKPIGL